MLENYKLEGELLNIHTYPDPVLKKVASPYEDWKSDTKNLCKNMLYTMYNAPGIGLAAPQVGLSKRIFVIDIDYSREKVIKADGSEAFELSDFNPRVFINPKIYDGEGEVIYEEGCLSVPGVYEEVKRFAKIKVDYQDIEGRSQSLEAEGLLAICIQHENDHLDGKVFIEKLSNLKFNYYVKKLTKLKKAPKNSSNHNL